MPLVALVAAACSVDSSRAISDSGQPADVPVAPSLEPATAETPSVEPTPVSEPTVEPFSVELFEGPLDWAIDEDLDGSQAVSIGVSGSILATRRTISTLTESGEWHRVRADDELDGFSGIFRGVADVLATPRGFLVLADQTIWESSNGIDWSEGYRIDDPERSASQDLFLNGETVIAPGSFDDQAALWTSTGSDEWQRTMVATDPAFESEVDAFVEGPTAKVVVGHRLGIDAELEERTPTIWVSVDDGAWEQAELTGDVTGRGGLLTTVVWSEPSGLYVAAGWDGVGSQTQGAIIFTSEDALTWARVSNPSLNDITFEGKLKEIVATESGFLAVGGDQYQDNIPGIFWRSSDAITWEASRIYSQRDAYLYSIYADGNTCIVSGELGTLVGPCFSIPEDATEID